MGSLAVSCQTVRTFNQLRSFETTWRDLHVRCSNPSGFTTWEWLWNWWQQFGPLQDSRTSAAYSSGQVSESLPFRQPLYLIIVRDESDEPIGMLPLYVSIHRINGMRLAVLRVVGDAGDLRENPFEEPLILLRHGREREAMRLIESSISQIAGDVHWDVARLAFPSPAQPEKQERRSLRSAISLQKLHATEAIPLPGSYETLRRSLNKSMRDNLSYYPRLLVRRGHTWSVRVAKCPTEVGMGTDTLIDLHRKRAAGTRGIPHVDHLPTHAQQNFIRDYLADLTKQKGAAVYLLDIDGIAAAAQIVLSGPKTISLYYSGFSMQWNEYSPLTILTAEILKDAISSGVETVNLLSGAHPWKKRWGAFSQGSCAHG